MRTVRADARRLTLPAHLALAPSRPGDDDRTDEEKLADAATEEAELRAAGVRVRRVHDVVLYGRRMLRHLDRRERQGARTARRGVASADAPDPLVEGLAGMPHKGRAWYVSRTLAADPAPVEEHALARHRAERDARRVVLQNDREAAHAAGYRRVARWVAAGRPTTLVPGRTPYRAGGDR